MWWCLSHTLSTLYQHSFSYYHLFWFMFCLWSSTPERRCLVLRCAAKAQFRTPHSNPGVKNAFSSWTLFKSYSDSIRGCCAIENVSRVLKEIWRGLLSWVRCGESARWRVKLIDGFAWSGLKCCIIIVFVVLQYVLTVYFCQIRV